MALGLSVFLFSANPLAKSNKPIIVASAFIARLTSPNGEINSIVKLSLATRWLIDVAERPSMTLKESILD
jgi:hypothetical protein